MKLKLLKCMLMISILSLLGCTTQKNYTFKKMKTKGEDVTVSGQVKDFNTKEALEAIMLFDSKQTQITQTNKAGKYKIILKKGKYQFVSVIIVIAQECFGLKQVIPFR